MKINHIKDIGAVIRKRRKSVHMSIAELSAMIPCSPRLLGEVERGTRKVSFDMAITICSLLGIELYAREREENK